jgi:hypothetical protein
VDCIGNGRDNWRLAIQWVRCGSHRLREHEVTDNFAANPALGGFAHRLLF